jgi:hypothetical protein
MWFSIRISTVCDHPQKEINARSTTYWRILLRPVKLLLSILLTACVSILVAQPSKSQLQQQCEAGGTGVCKSLSISACDGLTAADSAKAHAQCIRTARCYMKLAQLPKDDFPLKSGTAQRCEEHYQGNLATLAPSEVFVSWIPATSGTVDQLSPFLKSGLIAGALPPGSQSPAAADPADVPEFPYDGDNHVFLNVCQAHLKNADSGHIATVPGKFLNKNCNVVFEGEFLVAHEFELAVVTSHEHGYWMPLPAGADLDNALQSTPGPDGKAYTVCTAKIFTDTSYVENSLDAGVRWHGHHLGSLNSNHECVTEWGGSPVVSSIDVRVYFVGGARIFALPARSAWYVDYPLALNSSSAKSGSAK